MAHASPALRLRRRQRKTVSAAKRAVRQAAFEANRNFSTLVAVLAQLGGSITIPYAVLQATMPTIQKARWQADQLADGSLRVWLPLAEGGSAVPEGLPTASEATIVDEVAPPLTPEQFDVLKAHMQAAHNTPDAPAFTPHPRSVTADLAAALGDRPAPDLEPLPVDPTIVAEDPA